MFIGGVLAKRKTWVDRIARHFCLTILRDVHKVATIQLGWLQRLSSLVYLVYNVGIAMS